MPTASAEGLESRSERSQSERSRVRTRLWVPSRTDAVPRAFAVGMLRDIKKKTRSAAETGDVEMAPQDDDALALVRRRLAAAEGYRHVLRFDDVRMRYKPHLPYALRGLTFAIEAGTSTAVVGRTGAGKSSLIVVILRLVP